MARTRIKRKQLFVDPRVQGAILFRATMNWLCCMVTIVSLVLCWRMLVGPARPAHLQLEELWAQSGPALIITLLILPFVMYDMGRLTNRFAGPLFRLRNSMRCLARGEKVEPVHFRENDFWPEIAEEFNALIVKIERLEAERKASEPATANSAGS